MSAADLATLIDRIDKIADVVRDGALESERLGHLTPAVFDALHDAELFRILVPVELGGHGLTIPESIEVFERVAELDASTGWTLTILADGPSSRGNLAPDAFATICRDPLGLVAGTLNPTTRARTHRRRVCVQRPRDVPVRIQAREMGDGVGHRVRRRSAGRRRSHRDSGRRLPDRSRP